MSGFGMPTTSEGLNAELRAHDGLIAVGPEGIRLLRDTLLELGRVDDGGRAAAVVLGKGLRTPDRALEKGANILAGLLGVDLVETEVDRVRGDSDDAEGMTQEDEDLDRLPVRLRTKERELRELRADAAEVSGDLEFANMQWLRERQDAETQLLAYRDRARELKVRLQTLEDGGEQSDCPTCARTLADRYAEVIATIREEWESVVQDGSWWKRRRDQLELKPDSLKELEGRHIRLQAAVRDCAEEIERLRARLPELAGSADEGEGGSAPDENPRVRVLEALRTELADEARDLLIGRAGRYLNRLTAGQVLALTVDGDRFRFVRDEVATEPIGGAERAQLVLALRLALVDMCARHGLKLETLVFGGLLDELPIGVAVRAVVLLRGLLARSNRIIVECGPEVMKSAPEYFDWVLDVERTGTGSRLRALPGGVGKLRVH